MKNVHEPNMRTIAMVEKTILDSEKYPTKTAHWRSLPRKIQFQTFSRDLEYLEAHKIIAYKGNSIIYTAVKSDKLRALIETSTELR